MFSNIYLAMTAQEAEYRLPKKLAYMACHFSPYSTGLSNLPVQLPENSLLLLDDSTPVHGHAPDAVTEQLAEFANCFSPRAILLDFQRNVTAEALDMVSRIIRSVSCPVAVTEAYAKQCICPVFLSPPPANIALPDFLSSWKDRDIFLEIAPGGLQISVTEQNSKSVPLPAGATPPLPLADSKLHCHYAVEVTPHKAVFTIQRTREDLIDLVEEAKQLGICEAVGLYQELYSL